MVRIALPCYKLVTMNRKYVTNALQSQEKSGGHVGKRGQAAERQAAEGPTGVSGDTFMDSLS
jgi:hypothetical protein